MAMSDGPLEPTDESPGSEIPRISAVVCTRNYGDRVTDTVRSILANEHDSFELIVVDQSTDDSTQAAVEPFLSDGRLRYIRSATVGLSRCRNVGLNAARAEFVAITDDDCIVPANWLSTMEANLRGCPDVGMMYVSVHAGPHDSTAGFISAVTLKGREFSDQGRLKAGALEAGMAVRRDAALRVGGFDEAVGAGSVFPSGEGYDLRVRVIRAGYRILCTGEISVEHNGFYRWDQGRSLMERDCFGSGAVYAKHARLYGRSMAFQPISVLGWFTWLMVRDSVRARRPTGWLRLQKIIQGFQAGMRHPLDRASGKFVIEAPPVGSLESQAARGEGASALDRA